MELFWTGFGVGMVLGFILGAIALFLLLIWLARGFRYWR